MDDHERLAGYLDGELDDDERRALEAELAVDARVREQLDDLTRADDALTGLAPASPPEGARERLDAALAPVLAETTGDPGARPTAAVGMAPTTADAVGGPHDELAARRERPRWVTAAGVAAGLLVVSAGVMQVTGVGPTPDLLAGQDAAPVDDAMEADDGAEISADQAPRAEDDDAGITTFDAEDADELADDALDLDLPSVVDAGRSLDTDGLETDLAELRDGPDLQAVVDLDLPSSEGAELADRVQQQLLETDGPTTDEGAELDDDGATDLRRCVSTLLEDGGQAVPVVLELVEVEGDGAVLLGLVTADPATGRFTRAEAWALERGACTVLAFAGN